MAAPIPSPDIIPTAPDIPMVDRGAGFKEGTALYLVRHGESMTNTYENIHAFDPNLTALGWAQALAVARWMAENAPVDVVVTSPLRRAFSTALAIAHAHGLKPIELPGLEEFSHEFWDEMPFHHPTRPWWGRLDWEPTFEQAPGFVAFRDRVHQALAEVLERFGGKRICLVSHGGTMSVLTAAMVGSQHLSVWNHNTGISLFVWPEWKRWLMHYVNRTEHLLGIDAAAYPRVDGAVRKSNGLWRLPDTIGLPPVDPRLGYLANVFQRNHRILFLFPPDPFTPVRVSLRARRAIVVGADLLALEAGELQRARLNANHIRFEHLFLPLPYPDDYFHYVVLGAHPDLAAGEVADELARVLCQGGGIIRLSNIAEGEAPPIELL